MFTQLQNVRLSNKFRTYIPYNNSDVNLVLKVILLGYLVSNIHTFSSHFAASYFIIFAPYLLQSYAALMQFVLSPHRDILSNHSIILSDDKCLLFKYIK